MFVNSLNTIAAASGSYLKLNSVLKVMLPRALDVPPMMVIVLTFDGKVGSSLTAKAKFVSGPIAIKLSLPLNLFAYLTRALTACSF